MTDDMNETASGTVRAATAFCIGLLTAFSVWADKGPGTYFNPKDGNAVSKAARVENAAARQTVTFVGGSITEMNGFRPRVMKLLRERYKDVEFTEVAEGISSTCSDTGAFRMDRDVLKKGVPDILIVDVAVNDDQDGHFDRAHCIRGLEGIVRKALLANPRCRVVIAQMVNADQYRKVQKGEDPIPYAAGREVAKRYGAQVADIGVALVESAKNGGLAWAGYRDCHPSPKGCDFGAEVVMKALGAFGDLRKAAKPLKLPKPIDPLSYFNGREIDLRTVRGGTAWTVMRPDWKSIPGEKRGYFTQGDVLCCSAVNEPATIAFTGTALAALLTAGPDAGDLEVSVDGGPFRPVRLRADYGKLHYPYTQLLAEELKPGAHEVRLRVVASAKRNGASNVRINRLDQN